ncbi:vesicle transport protein [Elysia marginata]|uniref:Vesicle transport protein n=1 Tax=Elysia marginata TaxID=1093978 RepID=A0AAV4JE59_9GAST|nr:vesicle transport protein [Elysia marginata]
MANLGQSVKDYLSRNKDSQSTTKYTLLSSKWFSSAEDIEDKPQTEAADGWFSKAQSDPLLPSLAGLYIPLLALKARKFALLYSLGSLFVISSFALLWGPMNHLKHLFSVSRLPFTTGYFGTMFATLYFAMWVKSTIFTVFFAILQIVALVWYITSYIPGGQTGLKFFTSIFYGAASKTVGKALPI